MSLAVEETASLSHFVCAPDVDVSVKSQTETVKQQLPDWIKLTNDSDDYELDVTTRLKFLSEQIYLLFTAQCRYSADTLLIAFLLFVISASVYIRLHAFCFNFTACVLH